MIIDGHSFSSIRLPYELCDNSVRPGICLGIDKFHTPYYITEYLYNEFQKRGYTVRINTPFSGTIIPLRFYNKNKNVMSIMIEINRFLYMDEKTGMKKDSFNKVKVIYLKLYKHLPQIKLILVYIIL